MVLLIESIGSWDYEIAVDVEGSKQAVSIMQELRDVFSTYIQSVKVLPSFGYPKVQEYPFEDYRLAVNA